jgi:hypothetical protein
MVIQRSVGQFATRIEALVDSAMAAAPLALSQGVPDALSLEVDNASLGASQLP